jgi:hypothetical protein
MWSRGEGETLEAVQKILGEPVAAGLTDRAWRARTQLLSVALVAIGIIKFKLRVNTDATVLGFSLTGLSDHAVRGALVLAIAYLLLHFVWMAWESFAEWRLRLTGTRVAFATVGRFASSECDYPDDPRQSTLANWWRSSANNLGNLTVRVDGLRVMFADQQAAIREACGSGEPINVANATAPLNNIMTAANQLKQSIEATAIVLASLRIPASLDRFEKTYRHFLESQNIRWLLVDALLPIGVAAYALYTLFS